MEILLDLDLLPTPDLETSGLILVRLPLYTESKLISRPRILVPKVPTQSHQYVPPSSDSIGLILVLSGATVGKALLSSGSSPRATGVEFRDQSGTTYTANARREVIIATGSIKTPVILQQSGIGPASVLSAAGVTQRVDLPVGMNLIDQTTTSTSGSFRGTRGGGQPITFPRFQVCFRISLLLNPSHRQVTPSHLSPSSVGRR